MIIIKATIFYEKKFWVGTFERIDQKGYVVAKHTFGKEPTDPEVYAFILHHYQELKFGEQKQMAIQIHRMNPKRVQREVRHEVEKLKKTSKPSTFAQDYLREELEKNKKMKKALSSREKQEKKEAQFLLKQQKKKEKKKGH